MKPEELLYTKTHEWVHVTEAQGAKVATVGVSKFALEALTDLVFIDLPQVGRQVKAREAFGEIESVKAVSDLYSPVSGEVVEVNQNVAANLETMAQDPYGEGWLVKIKLSDDAELKGLLDAAAYERQTQEEAHEG